MEEINNVKFAVDYILRKIPPKNVLLSSYVFIRNSFKKFPEFASILVIYRNCYSE